MDTNTTTGVGSTTATEVGVLVRADFLYEKPVITVTTLSPLVLLLSNMDKLNLSQMIDLANFSSQAGRHGTVDKFQLVIYYLNVYFTPVIILVGLIGNFLSFLVFTFTHVKRLSSSVYLSALALADIIFLLALLIVWLSRLNVPLFTFKGWCECVVYVARVCGFLAVWMVLSFTAERYIVAYHPLQKDKLCTRRKATCVVLSLTAFAVTLYSYTFWTQRVISLNNLSVCGPDQEKDDLIVVMTSIDTVLASIVPSFVIVILNIKIIIKIHKYQTKRAQSLQTIASQQKLTCTYLRNRSVMHTSISTTGSMHIKFTAKSHEHLEMGDVTSANKNAVNRVNKYKQVLKGSTQYRTARMLLILSSVFVMLNLPSHIMKAQSFFEDLTSRHTAIKPRLLGNLEESFHLLYFLNFAINFFIYSACGRHFRTGLKRLCKRWKHDFLKCNKVIRYSVPFKKPPREENTNREPGNMDKCKRDSLVPGLNIKQRAM